MLKLRKAMHTVLPETVIAELLDEKNQLIAGVYATDNGLKIVSKHIQARWDLVVIEAQEPAAILVRLR